MSILKECTKEDITTAYNIAMYITERIRKDYFPESTQGESLRLNPNDKPNLEKRRLREFSVNGRKVMAYSRKDAITRLKHKK